MRIKTELHRNLTSGEYRRITARLGLFHMTELVLVKETAIGRAHLDKGVKPTEIILMKKGEAARLSYPQTFEKTPSWDGPRTEITLVMKE